ncbi:MAG: hypothetical protein H6708_01695 [Kofleriaceae bacterium]|nr:hypothetical protein [Kofleriaceae bacterium]
MASPSWRGLARAVIVVDAAAGGATEPLLRVPGAPLPGRDRGAARRRGAGRRHARGSRDRPGAVWLRAGPHLALWLDVAATPTLRLTARLDGPVLPVVLADALAAPPLAPVARAEVVTVEAPALAPAVPAGELAPRRGWPVRALLIVAALLIAIEAAATRARRGALAARVALVAGLGALAWGGVTRDGRRVGFVLDVSASVAPAEAAARAEVARRADALGPDDRAALIVAPAAPASSFRSVRRRRWRGGRGAAWSTPSRSASIRRARIWAPRWRSPALRWAAAAASSSWSATAATASAATPRWRRPWRASAAGSSSPPSTAATWRGSRSRRRRAAPRLAARSRCRS